MTDKAVFSVGHVKVVVDTNGHYRIAIEFDPESAEVVELLLLDAGRRDEALRTDATALGAALEWIDEHKVQLHDER